MTLCLSFGRYQRFPDFTAYWKHPGMFLKTNAWFPLPRGVTRGAQGASGFRMLSGSDSDVQSDLEITGLHTW